MRQLGINTIIVSGTTVLAQALTAIAFWLVARSVGPASFGILASAIGVATLLLTALDFGINSLTVRQLARRPDDVGAFVDTLSAKIMTSFGLGLIWTLLTLTVAIWQYEVRPLVILGLYVACSDVSSTLNVVARSREKFQIPAYTTLSGRVVMVALTAVILVFTEASDREYALPVGLVAGSIVSIAVAWSLLDPGFRGIHRATVHGIVALWRSSVGFGLSGLAAQIQRFDTLLVASIAGAASAGFYAAPARITGPLSVLPSALSTALFSRVSRSSNPDESRHEALRAIAITTLLSSALFAAIFVAATPLTGWIMGDQYLASVPVLRCFLVGLVLMSANAPLAAMFQAEGREVEVAWIVGRASIIGLAAVAIGAGTGGATGAAFGYIVLQFAILIPLLLNLRATSGQVASLTVR